MGSDLPITIWLQQHTILRAEHILLGEETINGRVLIKLNQSLQSI